MEGGQISRKAKALPAVIEPQERDLVLAPKDYFLGPVFAATKQTGPREVTIGDRRYQIGGFHPMRPEFRPPALDVRHARAIFALLSFRKRNYDSPLISFSFNELCRKYARTNGGRYARAIAEIVADLLDAYIRVTDLTTGSAHEYRLIERIDIEKRPPRRKDSRLAKSKQLEIWFNGCTLSPEFYGLVNRIAELQHLDLGVFTSIRSPLAQAIYLYIPSRAHHHNEADPFEITVTRLLEQVSVAVPAQKSLRKRALDKHAEAGRSVLQQLNGRRTRTGIFRVRLAETNDGADWKLQAWVEKEDRQLSRGRNNSKLIKAFLAAGRTEEELNRRLAMSGPLSDYELELLEAAKVEVEKNRRFFELAKALLQEPRFDGLLAEAKGDVLEGRAATKNPTARLIWRIGEAVQIRVKPAGSAENSGLDNGTTLRALYGQRGNGKV